MHVRHALLFAGAVVAGLGLGACGSAGSETASTAPAVSGVVVSDTPAASVALRDASHPDEERQVATDAQGNFSVDVGGLTPPYLLRAGSGDAALYAIAVRQGNADINGLTTVAVAMALGSEGRSSDDAWGADDRREAGTRLGDALRSLRTVLKPLFDLYDVTRIGGDDDGDVSGMRALLRDVSFTIQNGVVTITNRATGGVIFTAPLADLSSGVIHSENMPVGPGGGTGGACTYTYSAWGACQPNSTQIRTVVSSTPAGCTGTPVLAQSCTYVPPTPATCTSFTYSAWTPATCPASGQQTRTVATASPADCTGGSPALAQSCTYVPPAPATCTSFTYSAWTPATCPASGQQTRTVATASPADCTGGSPVLAQSCTYVPPAPATCTSFTYSAWTPATCPASGQQTRTVATASPAGCTGGSPVLSQACTYTPPIDGAALYQQKCASCHGALATSGVRGRTAAQITSASMTMGLNAAQVQAVADALK